MALPHTPSWKLGGLAVLALGMGAAVIVIQSGINLQEKASSNACFATTQAQCLAQKGQWCDTISAVQIDVTLSKALVEKCYPKGANVDCKPLQVQGGVTKTQADRLLATKVDTIKKAVTGICNQLYLAPLL